MAKKTTTSPVAKKKKTQHFQNRPKQKKPCEKKTCKKTNTKPFAKQNPSQKKQNKT